MQILWDGDAVPCCLDFDGKVILGNVFQTSISEVWNSKKSRDFREAHASQKFPEMCRTCDHLRPRSLKGRVSDQLERLGMLSVARGLLSPRSKFGGRRPFLRAPVAHSPSRSGWRKT